MASLIKVLKLLREFSCVFAYLLFDSVMVLKVNVKILGDQERSKILKHFADGVAEGFHQKVSSSHILSPKVLVFHFLGKQISN